MGRMQGGNKDEASVQDHRSVATENRNKLNESAIPVQVTSHSPQKAVSSSESRFSVMPRKQVHSSGAGIAARFVVCVDGKGVTNRLSYRTHGHCFVPIITPLV